MPDDFDALNLASDILIVDDEIPNLQLLTQVLSDAGYQSLRSARRPQLALASALAQPPNLILLDVRMPGMDGFEVCRRLKQAVQTRDIPILFVSARQDVQDRIRGFEAGGVSFRSVFRRCANVAVTFPCSSGFSSRCCNRGSAEHSNQSLRRSWIP